MSFSESVFSTGLNQKTMKRGLFVNGNHRIPPWDQCGKVPKDSRRLSIEGDHMSLTCGAARPHLEVVWPLWAPPVILFVMSVLHHLLGYIPAIISSLFDPRAKD